MSSGRQHLIQQLGKKFLAIDIETASQFKSGEDWRKHLPLGIACVTAYASDLPEPIVWVGKNENGYSNHMSMVEVQEMVRDLKYLSGTYTLVTWNGTGFDWPMIAYESAEVDACRELTRNHIDMMFHLLCVKGYPVGLATILDGMQLESKAEGMDGSKAVDMWQAGYRDDVIEYCIKDSQVTTLLAEVGNYCGTLQWLSRRGNMQFMDLSQGWLSVKDALHLPYPNTTYMNNPLTRWEIAEWLVPEL